ncbi:iron transporter [Altericroceibacterium spongiae]|uniref:iron transporter n=1 Tax=Altericroceibacterium spongiae TaxID=2320269 RepID=UPI001601182F|nr:iron transporter [Altericroceibacterium spongiae]
MVRAISRLRIAARVLAAIFGAYAVTAGMTALIAVLLVRITGVSRPDALMAGSMIGYLLFALLMLWCFAERRLARVWLVLLGAALASHLLAMWTEPTLPVSGPVDGPADGPVTGSAS